MANYTKEEKTYGVSGILLVNIADAVRDVSGTTKEYSLEDMPAIIRASAGGELQPNKTVSPTTSQQIVTPDTGYDGLEQVTVTPIQTETKTITENGTYTPTSGKYFNSVTVNV